MSIAACAAMPFGVWALASVDKGTIVTGVSAIIVAFVVLMWSGWKYRGRRSAVPSAAVGAVSGAMMATTSVGGPPVLLYLLSGNDPPAVNRANIVTYYFLTQFLLIVDRAGDRRGGLGRPGPRGRAVSGHGAGCVAGGRLFHGLASERLYRNVALGILFATGLFGLLPQLHCYMTSFESRRNRRGRLLVVKAVNSGVHNPRERSMSARPVVMGMVLAVLASACGV